MVYKFKALLDDITKYYLQYYWKNIIKTMLSKKKYVIQIGWYSFAEKLENDYKDNNVQRLDY